MGGAAHNVWAAANPRIAINKRGECLAGRAADGIDRCRRAYMCSIMTWPNPEQLTCVAPSISRAKS